eukprot:gene2806-5649_t
MVNTIIGGRHSQKHKNQVLPQKIGERHSYVRTAGYCDGEEQSVGRPGGPSGKWWWLGDGRARFGAVNGFRSMFVAVVH